MLICFPVSFDDEIITFLSLSCFVRISVLKLWTCGDIIVIFSLLSTSFMGMLKLYKERDVYFSFLMERLEN